MIRVPALIVLLAAAIAGCQSAARPIFPVISPPLVWPPPPDRPIPRRKSIDDAED